MSDMKENIRQWAETSLNADLYKWEDLHDIPLYMDQIITFLSQQLCLYRRDERDKPLTGTMINNYVKNEVIPHPQQKKYSRQQVAAILMVAMLKSVLSIQDLKILLDDCPDLQDFYQSFAKAQGDAMTDVSGQLTQALSGGDNLKLLALRLSAEANARRTAAERILWEIAREGQTKKPKQKSVKSEK